MYVVIIPPGLLGDSQSITSARNIPPVVTVTFNGSDGTNQTLNCITHQHNIGYWRNQEQESREWKIRNK